METIRNNDSFWIRLAKYFSREMNEEEKMDFEIDINTNNDMKNEYNSVKDPWEEASQHNTNVDVDNAWSKLSSKINSESPAGKSKAFPVYRWVAVAASVAVLILVGIGGYNLLTGKTGEFITYTAQNEKMEVVLPDGSEVTLNFQTTISYPEDFKGKNREVELKGEAFFNVVPDAQKPFIITANEAQIKVLGTSFNIYCRDKSGAEVIVEEGLVQLSQNANQNKIINLEPGYIGILKDKELIKKANPDNNYLSWKTRRIEFHNNNLTYVFSCIERTYNVTIEILDSEIHTYLHTGVLYNQSLENALEAIETAHHISIQKQGDVYQVMKKKL